MSVSCYFGKLSLLCVRIYTKLEYIRSCCCCCIIYVFVFSMLKDDCRLILFGVAFCTKNFPHHKFICLQQRLSTIVLKLVFVSVAPKQQQNFKWHRVPVAIFECQCVCVCCAHIFCRLLDAQIHEVLYRITDFVSVYMQSFAKPLCTVFGLNFHQHNNKTNANKYDSTHYKYNKFIYS